MDLLMHLMQEQRPMRVKLETAGGNVITGMVYAANVNVKQDILDVTMCGDAHPQQVLGCTHWDIEFKGTGPMACGPEEFAIDMRKKMSAMEWKCDYCASVNPRAVVKCPGCGASRSFVYG